MTLERRRPKTFWRRTERWAVGIAMALIAFVLERMVMRSVRKGRTKVTDQDNATTLRSKGGEVDL
jgi:hypothetical protein